MRHLKPETAEALAEPVTILSVSERRQRLLHLLRTEYKDRHFSMATGLEFQPPSMRDNMVAGIFEVAHQDPVFKAAGLGGVTYRHFSEFFEMGEDQIHAISCNCHGDVNGEQMARRLEARGFA